MKELQPQKYRNSCLDRGLLASLRDGELTPEETQQARAHLEACPDCAADERSMQIASQEIYNVLNFLEPSPDEIPETQSVLSVLQSRIEVESRPEESHTAAASST